MCINFFFKIRILLWIYNYLGDSERRIRGNSSPWVTKRHNRNSLTII